MPPPTGYLTATGIEACLQFLASTYPSICKLFIMPEKSIEGRTIRAIKIGKGSGAKRHAVLFIGGVHAREVVNPDLLVSLALKLCRAYIGGTGLTFGGKVFNAPTIKLIVEAMDIYVLPLVNPDGRVFVQSPSGDAMWRKNRNPNPGLPCKGVDINRNYDFLFSSGIMTSSSSCSDVFKGSAAFSEPETRNVRHMLDRFPQICCMADVHSYSQLILYPWGDDNNQTTDPAMNFQNPVFDGLRGTSGDTAYKEFIPEADLDFFVATGNRMRDAIAEVAGTVYTVEQAVLLYPTSGTSKDYSYSRHFVDATKRKVSAYTVETGTQFQPTYATALNVIREVSAGLVRFCLSCLCVVEETLAGTTLTGRLDDMRAFRDQVLRETPKGRRYVSLLEDNGVELMQIILRDKKLRAEVVDLTKGIDAVVRSRKAAKPKVFGASIIQAAEKLSASIASKASPTLKKAIEEVRRDIKHFSGRGVLDGLKLASGVQGPTSGRK
jgi:carboxypeptidase T